MMRRVFVLIGAVIGMAAATAAAADPRDSVDGVSVWTLTRSGTMSAQIAFRYRLIPW
jgi:hypothetical protein